MHLMTGLAADLVPLEHHPMRARGAGDRDALTMGLLARRMTARTQSQRTRFFRMRIVALEADLLIGSPRMRDFRADLLQMDLARALARFDVALRAGYAKRFFPRPSVHLVATRASDLLSRSHFDAERMPRGFLGLLVAGEAKRRRLAFQERGFR